MSLFKLPKALCDSINSTLSILVGANKGWEEDTLDKLEKIMQYKKQKQKKKKKEEEWDFETYKPSI